MSKIKKRKQSVKDKKTNKGWILDYLKRLFFMFICYFACISIFSYLYTQKDMSKALLLGLALFSLLITSFLNGIFAAKKTILSPIKDCLYISLAFTTILYCILFVVNQGTMSLLSIIIIPICILVPILSCIAFIKIK